MKILHQKLFQSTLSRLGWPAKYVPHSRAVRVSMNARVAYVHGGARPAYETGFQISLHAWTGQSEPGEQGVIASPDFGT